MNNHSTIEHVITPKDTDLGGFSVRRVLPAAARRTVGPFVFFDHLAPAEFPPGEGIQVRPHPHIGLATVTYLFEGEITHRDSLGCVQTISPGALNLMTAGRGIVHSERAPQNLDVATRMHGIQIWIALPGPDEECAPAFDHYSENEVPQIDIDGVAVRVLIGEAFGLASPVKTYSPTLYLECRMPAGSMLTLPPGFTELAAYVVDGEIEIDNRLHNDGVMVVARNDQAPAVVARKDSHVMVIGGDSVGRRHLWWNFVSSSKERIELAKTDWKEGRFDAVPGETEFIPLPDK